MKELENIKISEKAYEILSKYMEDSGYEDESRVIEECIFALNDIMKYVDSRDPNIPEMTQENAETEHPIIIGNKSDKSDYMYVRCEEKEYTVYYDSQQRGLYPICTIKGPDGLLRVWDDGEKIQVLYIDDSQLQPCEKSGVLKVDAKSYREAREEAHRIFAEYF